MALTDKNLFAYCDNNPIMRLDPSGNIWVTIGIMAVGGIIGAGISAVGSAITQKALTGRINWKSVGVAAVSGLVSGAVAASPLGLPCQIIAGGIIGGGSYVADCKVNNVDIKPDEALISIVGGCISGYIGGAGANKDYALTRVIESTVKTCNNMALRNCKSYATKVVLIRTGWLKNIVSVTTFSSSFRFSFGCGVTNGMTAGYTRLERNVLRGLK